MNVRTANALWAASCTPEWLRFRRSAGQVEETQSRLLQDGLRRNRDTEVGRRYGFDSIATAAQYRARLPLTTYADYEDDIRRLAAGERAVLTSEPVRMFERSSGSTAASKLIPYTAALKSEFRRGVSAWISDLYRSNPELRGGPAYWSVTPLTSGPEYTPAGIPIGFESDSDYLGFFGKSLAAAVMAVPDEVKRIPDIDAFRYATLFHLLRRPDLRLISVWNPTFLGLLMAPLTGWWERLLQDIETGGFSPIGSAGRLRPYPQRARALRAVSPQDPPSIWPELRLISCWTDGPAGPYARRLEADYPQAMVQGKGLLATEAMVSFPLLGVEGCVLSVRSHFFEFLDEAGEPRLAHQVERGQAYSVVVTTGGGFYRYQLHDIVEVVGFWGQAPCLRFVGKARNTSDLFGEKLEEGFVARVLERLFSRHGVAPAFAMLAPEAAEPVRYVLYIEAEIRPSGLAVELDAALRENFHYDYCRRLGQLDAAETVPVRNGAAGYLQACLAKGQKLGNIKPSVLQRSAGWADVFERMQS